jgi:predicted amidohydrolase YtcJ
VEEAVRGYTLWAQRAAFVELRRGMLAPGLDADLTVLDRDPFDPTTKLAALRPVMAFVGGQRADTPASREGSSTARARRR